MQLGIVILLGLLVTSVFPKTFAAIQENNAKQLDPVPNNPQPDRVEGTWLITFDGPRPGEHRSRTLTLQRDTHGKLTGTLDAPVCPCTVVGSSKRNKVKLTVTPKRGGMSVTYLATVKGDMITGEAFAEGIPSYTPSTKFVGTRKGNTDFPVIPKSN